MEDPRLATYKFDYMMLSRLESDCKYFLGWGHQNEKDLWAGNVPDHIEEMKKLWNKFPEDLKPEWLAMDQIEEYERLMNSGACMKDIPCSSCSRCEVCTKKKVS